MTVAEKDTWNYLYEERLGILLGDAPSTPEARAIAKADADVWLLRQLREQIDAMP